MKEAPSSNQKLQTRLREIAESLLCREGSGHYCPNCGNTTFDAAMSLKLLADQIGAPDETTDVRIKNLTRALHAKQAKIDALMLEFCPGEMQAEQKSEWAEHQQRSLEEPRETSRDDARDAARYRYIRQGEDMLSPEDEDHYNKMWQTILPKGCDRKRMDTAIDAAIAKSSAVEPTPKPSRDAEHCDYPDCEQHWTHVVAKARALLEPLADCDPAIRQWLKTADLPSLQSGPPLYRHDWETLPGQSYRCRRCKTTCLDAHDALLCAVRPEKATVPHVHVWSEDTNMEDWAICNCGEVAEEWYCPTSPDHICHYNKGNYDSCDHCGKPEERK